MHKENYNARQHEKVSRGKTKWSDDPDELTKKSPSNSLTKYGRAEIVRLHNLGVGPLSIAVRVGVNHNQVQDVLFDLCGRARDFMESEYRGANPFFT